MWPPDKRMKTDALTRAAYRQCWAAFHIHNKPEIVEMEKATSFRIHTLPRSDRRVCPVRVHETRGLINQG
jgi:hypothetical protein